jgi:hypothetical protein
MRSISMIILALCMALGYSFADDQQCEIGDQWIRIFDGQSLSGWRASENPDSFAVEGGVIVVRGERAHLFYEGDVGGADFKNFEFKCRIKTHPKANSGVFFHTAFQPSGWPRKGYEVQVNATHPDRRKTGSVYAVKDVMDTAPNSDGEWFELYFKVDGDRITVKVDGEIVNEYVEQPGDIQGERRLSSGTIAIQAHDPGSLVHYKDIYIRLPSDAGEAKSE